MAENGSVTNLERRRSRLRISGALFVALAPWILLLLALAGAVSIDASSILIPWAGLAAIVGLALVIAPSMAWLGLLGASFGVASTGFGLVQLTQSTSDFYVALAVLIGLSIGGAAAAVLGLIRQDSAGT